MKILNLILEQSCLFWLFVYGVNIECMLLPWASFFFSCSRCMSDVHAFNKVSRSHSFAMTSPSTSDPPSLEDLDVPNPKQYGTQKS